MAKIDAVVFDMDGLMFETEKLWIDSVIKINEVSNYNLPIELAIECIGKRKDDGDKRIKEVMGNDFDTETVFHRSVSFPVVQIVIVSTSSSTMVRFSDEKEMPIRVMRLSESAYFPA